MKLFKDKNGRDWSIDINVNSIKQLKARLNVNLLEVVEGENLIQKMTDPVLLVDTLYVLCEAQAIERKITDEQFGASMGGDALDAASGALFEDLADFFPNGRRQMLKKALAKVTKLQQMALDRANQMLDSDQLEKSMQKRLNALSGNSPESSASTPANTPSDNSPGPAKPDDGTNGTAPPMSSP